MEMHVISCRKMNVMEKKEMIPIHLLMGIRVKSVKIWMKLLQNFTIRVRPPGIEAITSVLLSAWLSDGVLT